MLSLNELLERAILEESASENEIADAINGHKRVIINYRSDGKDEASGPRVIEVYVYGLSLAGNPVIRAFQPYGSSLSGTPKWKLFRIDRITEWRTTEQRFSQPASDIYKGLPPFNKDLDKCMSVVYLIAKFGEDETVSDEEAMNISQSGIPKLKDVYKTDTETRMQRTREMLANPLKLADLTKPKTVDPGPQLTKAAKEKEADEIFKTDTERGLDNLAKQLENPKKIDLSKFTKQDKANEEEPEIESDDEEETEDLFKTDTERGLNNLAKQLDNPRKIDLSKIPKR